MTEKPEETDGTKRDPVVSEIEEYGLPLYAGKINLIVGFCKAELVNKNLFNDNLIDAEH